MVADEEDDQVRRRRDQHEHAKNDPNGQFAPPTPAQTTGELAETLDRSGRAEGIQLRVRHVSKA